MDSFVKHWYKLVKVHIVGPAINYFGRILEYYGNRILLINIVRDGRDVVTSKHPKHRPKDYYLDINRWINDIEIGLTFTLIGTTLYLSGTVLLNNSQSSHEANEFFQKSYTGIFF